MIEILVVLACFLTYFANMGSLGSVLQAGAIGLLLMAAALAVIQNRMSAVRTTTAELSLYAIGIVSALLGLIQGEDGLVVFALGLLVCLVAMSILVRALTLESFLDIGAAATLLCILITLVMERGTVLTALSASVGRNGLLRFTPLGNHPNLTGYMFGAGSILLVRRMILAKGWMERAVMAGGALLSWAFILAASARSSLVGLIVAAGLALVFERRVRQMVSFKWLSVGAVMVAILGFVVTDKLTNYFNAMLQLDSASRGVASGGSGRVDIWWHGVEVLFSDPVLLVFGGGFRSSSSDMIGFSTESSYITILLDSGLFLGSIMIALFWYAPVKAMRLSAAQELPKNSLVLLSAVWTFLVIESVFNRYLLAVGNPVSLLSLMLLLSLSMRPVPVKATGVVAAGKTSPGAAPAPSGPGISMGLGR